MHADSPALRGGGDTLLSGLARSPDTRQFHVMRNLFPCLPLLALAACTQGPGPVVPDTKTERQMIGLLQKFDRWDLDGNGKLDAAELKPASALSGKSVAEILAYYDVNKDGGITLREAQKGLEKKVDAHEGEHAERE